MECAKEWLVENPFLKSALGIEAGILVPDVSDVTVELISPMP